MAANGVKAVHCPFSNCGKGVPNTPRLLESGISVAFGTDGTAHGGMSLFQEMKIFRSIMNIRYGVPESNPVIMPAETILSMALEGGSCALGLHNKSGQLKEGFCADLIAIDLDQPHLYPTNNLIHTLVESVSSQDELEPVVPADQKEILSLFYASPFFFSARVFKDINLVPIELQKVYRQTDPVFINILDRIRSNIARKQELDTLNARYFPDFIPRNEDMYITLATRRDQFAFKAFDECDAVGGGAGESGNDFAVADTADFNRF